MNDYDLEKLSTFITYLDKNNLYGWSVNEKSDIGYILEVDLEYPKELHDYRLAPEKRAVSSDAFRIL